MVGVSCYRSGYGVGAGIERLRPDGFQYCLTQTAGDPRADEDGRLDGQGLAGKHLAVARAIADIDAAVVEDVPIVNPRSITAAQRRKLTYSFRKLLKTDAKSIFDELSKQPDSVTLDKVKREWRKLDKVVMDDMLGLTDEEQFEVYSAVVALVRGTKDSVDVHALAGAIPRTTQRTQAHENV